MAQSLLTIDMITNKALEILENNLVITRNVNRQYDDSFAVEGAKIGDTLRIRLPDRALVTDGAALQVQEVNQQFTTLTIASQKHIGVNFTSAELALSMDDFADRVLKPRVSQLAASIDADVANAYKDISSPWAPPVPCRPPRWCCCRRNRSSTRPLPSCRRATPPSTRRPTPGWSRA